MEDDRDAVPTRADRPGAESRPRATSTEDPVIGRASTAQRYLVDREIARGGMGRVVEAIDTVLGRTVALKEALVDDDDTLRRFARETRITAKLEHPSIVPVYDAGTAPDGRKFYVMRKVSGKPLDELVGAATTLDARLALVPHVLAAAQAIAHAHQRSILHRDVKPPNILVGELGETIVIDWGLAKEFDEQDPDDPRERTASQSLMTRYGAVIGTPGFMPPEQVKGESVDERGDVFALGATLYYVLAGKPPFRGNTGDDVMRDTLERPAKALHDVVPGVPAELATIAGKALAAAAEDRYRDAGALAQDLQRFLAGQLVASHDYTAVERALRFVRRHRLVVAVIAIAMTVLAVGAVIAVDRILDARDAAAAEAENAKRERAEADVARTQANDRADELTLDKARLSIATNPTGAVALLKRLAASPVYWREVRDLAASARAAGVAWELPAPKATRVSVAGNLAVSGGDDGVIRRFDLRARTTEVLAEVGKPVRAVIAPDGKRVIGYAGTAILRLDLATRVRSDVTAPAEIERLAVIPGGLAWTDKQRMYLLPDGSSTPERLDYELHPRITLGAWVSPDGRWLGVCSTRGLELISTAALDRRFHFAGKFCFPQWWTADMHLINVLELEGQMQTFVELELGDTPKELRRSKRPIAAWTDPVDGLYVLFATELAAWGGDGRRARGRTAVTRRQSQIDIKSDTGDATLLVPTKLRDVGAAPDSPFVVALTAGQLWIWNLDDLLPWAIPDAGGSATFTGHEQVVTQKRWLDLRTRESSPLPRAEEDVVYYSLGQRDTVLATTNGRGRNWIIRRDHPAPIELTVPSFNGFQMNEPDRVVFGQRGAVIEVDLRTQQRTTLVERDAAVKWMRGSADWIIAAYSDDTVWRLERATGKSAMRVMPHGQQAQFGNGVAYAIDGTQLHAWRTDGSVVELTLPHPIADLTPIDHAHVLVSLVDHPSVLAVIDGAPRILTIPVRDPAVALGSVLEVVETRDPRTEIQLLDHLTGIRWTAARSTSPRFWNPRTWDDRYLLSNVGTADQRGEPALWTLALPTTPAATAAWLDTMTNVR